MITCLYPDCDYISDTGHEPNIEAEKREIIDHINAGHDDAHVIIACVHDWQEQERFMARTFSQQFNRTIDVGMQLKSQCARCGQSEITDAEGPVDGGEAADDVTVSG